ncbi:MAG TPA: hypothetical protein VNZ22_21345, partial [Bacillota bacterium]|nr:hypothetical protein [Bacillota bacterium]
MKSKAFKLGLWGLAGLLVILLGFLLFGRSRPLPKAQLADGRILQVEGVSFGTKHVLGTDSFLKRFSPWLPARVNQYFDPGTRRSEITLEEPGLVAWVNAIDPVTGKHVDCQGIRVEFVDQTGDRFGEASSSWFGGNNFWRVGHIFHAYPRAQRQLTLLVTPWKTNGTTRLEFPNPHVSPPAAWSGRPLPQRQRV